MHNQLIEQISPLLQPDQIWAFTSTHSTEHSTFLHSLRSRQAELVSFRHAFKNLSNTNDFYYQQRYHSMDADDAHTVRYYLNQTETQQGYWNLDTVTELLDLQTLLDVEVIKLSNGETRRVLIGAALVKNPAWLLLDHPFTGLDKTTRQRFNRILEKINQSGVRILLAVGPHDIPSGVTHVAWIGQNELIASGSYPVMKALLQKKIIVPDIDKELLKKLLGYRQHISYQHILQMQDVQVEYAGKIILSNINWTVRQGEKWILSGPNGAGKSTLLSLINGDHPQAYANKIVLFDKQRGSGESIWDIKKKIGFISPELFQYFPDQSTCLQVIESGFFDTMGLFKKSNEALAAIATDWMKLFHIDSFATQLFNRVPSDVQRLCLLSRALIKNPGLLLLDEPTQGLTETQQLFFTQIIEEIASLPESTIIYVSHYENHIPRNIKNRIELQKP